MSALKKKIISHNISKFLEDNLLVFFFNYNHITIEEWRTIKNQLSKVKKVNTKVIKNQIANNVIKNRSVCERDNRTKQFDKLSTLFQGPTFIIGITSTQECKDVFNIIKKQKKLIFIGGLYQGQLVNHLDVEYLLKVEKLAYANLISTLQYSLYLTPITTNLIQFYYLLKRYERTEKGEK